VGSVGKDVTPGVCRLFKEIDLGGDFQIDPSIVRSTKARGTGWKEKRKCIIVEEGKVVGKKKG